MARLLAFGILAAGLLSSPALAQAPAAKGDSAKKKDLPLEAARTATFTTSQGTWMSVDVSPDGSTLVFDLLGDLYTLPIAGGRATRLTSGMAYDAQPRFSPDGKRVAFVSDRSGGEGLWILSLDGKDTVQVTKGNHNLYHSPEWTPDGKYLVASKSGGLGGTAKLWLYHVEGGTGTALIKEPANLKTIGAAFGPDPRYLWYAARTGDWQYNAVLPQYQLAVYDRETGTTTTMSGRYGSAFRPAVSPDGKWLAYGSRHDLHTGLRLRDLATGDERWLAWPVQRDDQESRAPLDVLPGFSFTPDSRSVVASYGGELWRVPLDGTAAAKIPFTAEVAVPVGPEVTFAYRMDDAATFTARQIRDIAPSPDGSKLAFVALDRLYVVDLPGGTPRRVTTRPAGEYMPAWSPDGQWIAFTSWDDATGGHLWKARADGRGQPVRLTSVAALYSQTSWSPNGARIVAVRAAARDLQESIGFFGGGLGAEFVWVPAAGGAVTVIAPTTGLNLPHFTADTSRFYAYSGSQGLVSMRWDGTDRKSHLKVVGAPMPGGTDPHDPTVLSAHLDEPVDGELEPTAPPPPANMILMAPRGDQALARVGGDLYVVTVPQVGGDVPSISVANPANATFPVRKLTDIGGEFPTWSADARRIHWSLGNALLTFDLDRAKAVEDSLKAAGAARPDSAAARADTGKTEKPGYKPVEQRVAVTATRDAPRGVVVLRGGRAITMRGDEIIENADVVVRDSRIVAVGARGTVTVPAGAEVIDVSGKTVMPGFVDLHYHAQWLIPGIHTGQVWQYLTNLAYGVTTTRDPQTATTDILTYADRVEAGEMLGPRIYSTGPGVFAGEQIRDQDHARSVLKRYSEYWDTKTFKMYMSGNRQQRQWLIIAAKELGLMPTTEGGLDFKLNLTHAMDGYPGIEHALPITPIYRDVIELFKASQTTNAPTLLVSYGGPFGENFFYTTEEVHDDPKLRRFTPEEELDSKTRRRGNNPGPGGWFRPEEYVFSRHAEFIRDLVRAGGRAGIGSHGQLQGLGYHWELWATGSGGLTPHETLRLATQMGAEAIGFGSEVGSLETGKFADILVLDQDPLTDLRNSTAIRYVMKNGRLYEGETLDEVWPRKRALGPQPWQNVAPATAAGIR